MFENFLLNKNAMKVLLWLKNHDGEYTAETIQDDIELDSFELVKYLHLLYTLGVCEVNPDNDTESLFVTSNKDSLLLKSLNDIEDFIDEKMKETPEIEAVLGGKVDDFKNLIDDNANLKIDELLAQCQEDVDESVDVTREDIIKFLVIFNNVFGVEQ